MEDVVAANDKQPVFVYRYNGITTITYSAELSEQSSYYVI